MELYSFEEMGEFGRFFGGIGLGYGEGDKVFEGFGVGDGGVVGRYGKFSKEFVGMFVEKRRLGEGFVGEMGVFL